ncbi:MULTISPECIES: glycosyltransferase family 2 protein [Priestia]|uniref:glycosyltransferase family 2 protein n=1 Tax=Priestia TaxID=2800373 RepID=UPI00112D0F61|nr:MULTISPECIES: glycosyltransferase family 2 protein [Priestia]
MEEVSVIIPTYNRAHLLMNAVNSILDQTYKVLEIIIIDDCSTDNTQELVKTITNNKIKYIKNKTNQGGAESRNIGAKYASGKFIAFLDSDDHWEKSKLEQQMTILNTNDSIGVVYSGIKIIDGTKQNKTLLPDKRGDLSSELLMANCVGSTSTVVIRRELFNSVKGFDKSMPSCQDWDLWIRLSKITHFDYIKEALVNYYEHPGERITTNTNAVVNGHLRIFNKYQEDINKLRDKEISNVYFYIGKVIAKSGMINLESSTLSQSRNFFKKAIQYKRYNIKAALFYISTFISKNILKEVYMLTKNMKKFKKGTI